MACSQSSEEPVAATSRRRKAGQNVTVYSSSSDDDEDTTMQNGGTIQEKGKLQPAKLKPSVKAAAVKPAKKRKICSKQHGQLLLPQAMRKAAAVSAVQLVPPAADEAAAGSAAPAQHAPQNTGHAPEQHPDPAHGSAEPANEPAARCNSSESELLPEITHEKRPPEQDPLSKPHKAAVLKWTAPRKSIAAADGLATDKGTEWSASGTRRSSRLAQNTSRPQYEDDGAAMDADEPSPPPKQGKSASGQARTKEKDAFFMTKAEKKNKAQKAAETARADATQAAMAELQAHKQRSAQEAAARNVGRTIHPAFQRKAMPAINSEAPPRSSVAVELPAEPALLPVHILQGLPGSQPPAGHTPGWSVAARPQQATMSALHAALAHPPAATLASLSGLTADQVRQLEAEGKAEAEQARQQAPQVISVDLMESKGGNAETEAAAPGQWTHKHRPASSAQVCGNSASAQALAAWLQNWQPVPAGAYSRKRRKVAPDDSESEELAWSDDEDEELLGEEDGVDGRRSNAAWISGPVGCGKSAAIAAIAQELELRIIEVGPGIERTGAAVTRAVGEALQSNNLSATSVACLGLVPEEAEVLAAEDKGQQASAVVVFEEVDSLADQDRGFLSAVASLVTDTKRPILLLSNSAKSPAVLPHMKHISFASPSQDDVSKRVCSVLAAEQLSASSDTIRELSISCQGDLRRALLAAQLWGPKLSLAPAHNHEPQPSSRLALWHHCLPKSALCTTAHPAELHSHPSSHPESPAPRCPPAEPCQSCQQPVVSQDPAAEQPVLHPAADFTICSAAAEGASQHQERASPTESREQKLHTAGVLQRLASALDLAACHDRLHGTAAACRERRVGSLEEDALQAQLSFAQSVASCAAQLLSNLTSSAVPCDRQCSLAALQTAEGVPGLDPPGLWTWPAAQSLAYLAPASWVQGPLNQHDRVTAMGQMARHEHARQAEEMSGGSKRKARGQRGFHNYLVSNLGLPEWVRDELDALSGVWNKWGATSA